MNFLYIPLFLIFPILTFAAEPNNRGAEYKNVGLSDPSLEIKTKFPVCEKVLNVIWINKDRKIGYADYDIYWADGTYLDKFKAFVDLGSPENRFTYKIVAYYPKNPNDGREDLIPERVKNHAKYPYFVDKVRLVGDNFDSLLTVVKKFNSVDEFFGEKSNAVVSQFSENLQSNFLTNSTKNVCIIFPDNSQAWLAEARSITSMKSKEEIERLYEKLKLLYREDLVSINKEAHRKLFNSFSVFDINMDGEDDYFDFYEIIYSTKTKSGEIQYRYKDYFKCSASVWQSSADIQLHTDGKNFYFRECNLTKLISQ